MLRWPGHFFVISTRCEVQVVPIALTQCAKSRVRFLYDLLESIRSVVSPHISVELTAASLTDFEKLDFGAFMGSTTIVYFFLVTEKVHVHLLLHEIHRFASWNEQR